jgi:hypothetical protein
MKEHPEFEEVEEELNPSSHPVLIAGGIVLVGLAAMVIVMSVGGLGLGGGMLIAKQSDDNPQEHTLPTPEPDLEEYLPERIESPSTEPVPAEETESPEDTEAPTPPVPDQVTEEPAAEPEPAALDPVPEPEPVPEEPSVEPCTVLRGADGHELRDNKTFKLLGQCADGNYYLVSRTCPKGPESCVIAPITKVRLAIP